MMKRAVIGLIVSLSVTGAPGWAQSDDVDRSWQNDESTGANEAPDGGDHLPRGALPGGAVDGLAQPEPVVPGDPGRGAEAPDEPSLASTADGGASAGEPAAEGSGAGQQPRERGPAMIPSDDADVAIIPGAYAPRERLHQMLQPLGPESRVFSVGGYIQPSFEYTGDTPFNPNDYDGFNFRATRLFARARYSLIEDQLTVGARVELDFAEGNAVIKDLFGTVGLWGDRLLLDFGQSKMAYSQFLLTGDGVRQFALPRNFEPNFGRLAGYRDRGVRARLNVPIGQAHLTWFVSLMNGEGENVNRNQDSRFLYSTFLEIAPLGRMSMDEPDLLRGPLRVAGGGSLAYTPSIGASTFGNPGVNNSELRYGVHGRLSYRGLAVRGEYLGIAQERPEDGSPQVHRRGWYVQAGYILPWIDWPAIELVSRVQQFDLDTTRDGFESAATGLIIFDVVATRRYEVGVGAYLLDHRLKAQVLYRVTQLLEGNPTDTNGNRLIGDSLFFTLQFGAF